MLPPRRACCLSTLVEDFLLPPRRALRSDASSTRVEERRLRSTTGARYGTKIDSTKDRNAPYRWTLGDGSTIAGLEQAIIGGNGVPPMLPGGVRRIVVPSKLAYVDRVKEPVRDPESARWREVVQFLTRRRPHRCHGRRPSGTGSTAPC